MAPMILLNLPTELLHHITSYLSYASHFSLVLTCKAFRARLKDPNQRPDPDHWASCFTYGFPRPYGMSDLLEIELWPTYRPTRQPQYIRPEDRFACRGCLRLRSALHFTNAMMKGKRGKEGLLCAVERGKRICIPCGISQNVYPGGTTMEFGGKAGGKGFICKHCSTLVRDKGQARLAFRKYYCDRCWGPLGCSKMFDRWQGGDRDVPPKGYYGQPRFYGLPVPREY